MTYLCKQRSPPCHEKPWKSSQKPCPDHIKLWGDDPKQHWPSWSTGPAQRRRTWRRWKRMSRTRLTTCHLSKFNGELLLLEHVKLSLVILSRSVTQIVPPGLSALMAKAWAVRKQPGPTGNITAIEHCHQSSLKSWKMSMKKSTVQQLNDVSIFNSNGRPKLFNFFDGHILPLLALI